MASKREPAGYAPWVFVALTAVFAVWTGFGVGGKQVALHVDDLATMAAALIATMACARVALRHGGQLRLFWWLLGAACAAWTLGEAVWASYDFVAGDVPAASWADAAYLAAVPLTAAALLVHPALRGRAAGRIRSLVDGLMLAAALFLLAWTLVFEPVRHQIDLSSLGGLVTLAYPLGDVVIVLLVVLVIRGTTTGDRRDLWGLLAGLLLIAFSDAVYTYLTNVRNYASGNVIDTGWFAGYLAIAVGALNARMHLSERQPETTQKLTTAAILAPFLPILAALSFAAIWIQFGHHLDHVTLVAAFVLVGLVLVRQLLLLIDMITRGEHLVDALGVGVADHHDERDAALRGTR